MSKVQRMPQAPLAPTRILWSSRSGPATRWTSRSLLSILASALLAATTLDALSETLPGALSKAYFNNPTLNAERAAVRAADEAVPIANADDRPHASATLDLGLAHIETAGVGIAGAYAASGKGLTSASRPSDRSSSRRRADATSAPRGFAIGIDQNLFDGLRTTNRIRAAETGVFQERELLRLTEQSVLQSGAQAYTDVLRDTAVLDLRRSDLQLFAVRLKEAHDRLNVGDVTPTDVAQVEARFAGSQAAFSTAEADLQNSIASFREVIGELPTHLAPAHPIERGMPVSLADAIAISQIQHPAIQASLFAVDKAALLVKTAEGGLYPTVTAHGGADRHDDSNGVPGNETLIASADLNASVPLYSGGSVFAAIRRAKEELVAAQAQAQAKREEVRAAVVSAWGLLTSSHAAIHASQLEIHADEVVVLGMREESRIGQRTMLDVLDAQQALLRARISLVRAQRDEIVASYAVVASIGRLSASAPGLAVRPYDPTLHFDQVKDKWFGLRTPDGR